MNAEDYLRAVAAAAQIGLEFPRNESDCDATSWDPQLQIQIQMKTSQLVARRG